MFGDTKLAHNKVSGIFLVYNQDFISLIFNILFHLKVTISLLPSGEFCSSAKMVTYENPPKQFTVLLPIISRYQLSTHRINVT